jgi:hypothetical protein
MDTITLVPDSSTYSEYPDGSRVGARLDGAMSRVRANLLNVARLVDISWTCNPTEYAYLRTVFRGNVRLGGPPYLIYLILNGTEPAPFVSKFVPNSVQLSEQSGNIFVVKAQVWAMPTKLDFDPPWLIHRKKLIGWFNPIDSTDATTAAITNEGNRDFLIGGFTTTYKCGLVGNPGAGLAVVWTTVWTPVSIGDPEPNLHDETAGYGTLGVQPDFGGPFNTYAGQLSITATLGGTPCGGRLTLSITDLVGGYSNIEWLWDAS